MGLQNRARSPLIPKGDTLKHAFIEHKTFVLVSTSSPKSLYREMGITLYIHRATGRVKVLSMEKIWMRLR